MKGFIENTIPQRQYENIKVRYYFENEKEKIEAIRASISDCIQYKGGVQAEIEKANKVITKDGYETFKITGVDWRRKDGKSEWFNETTKQWEG